MSAHPTIDLVRYPCVHLQSFLQHVSKELYQLHSALSLIAENEIPKERKEELASRALPDIKKLRAYVDERKNYLRSLAEVSRLTA
jgi:hypothetical protein